ncbi:hypothetical protein [Streptomyces sp. NPDC091371]
MAELDMVTFNQPSQSAGRAESTVPGTAVAPGASTTGVRPIR